MAADQSRLANQGQLRELDRTMAPVIWREIEQANSMAKIQALQDQVESIRGIMERNVEMILDRQVDLGHHLPYLYTSLHTLLTRTPLDSGEAWRDRSEGRSASRYNARIPQKH